MRTSKNSYEGLEARLINVVFLFKDFNIRENPEKAGGRIATNDRNFLGL
jgi:hypothetical protein